MLLRYFSQFDGQSRVAFVRGDRLSIGSNPNNDIVLNSPFVDARSVEMWRVDDVWQLKSTGLNGCELAGDRIKAGELATWDGTARLSIFPFVLEFQKHQVDSDVANRRYLPEIHQLVKLIHLDMLEQLHLRGSAEEIPQTTEALLHLERSIESSAAYHGLTKSEQTPIAVELSGVCVRDEILTMLLDRDRNDAKNQWLGTADWTEMATAVSDLEEELKRWSMTCMRKLFEQLPNDTVEARIEKVEKDFWALWDRVSPKLPRTHCDYLGLRQLKKQVKDILFGFGPLEDLLRMPTICEIMVNASDEIFVEKGGILQHSGRQFVSDEVTLTVIERIVGKVGRRIDTAQPMVDARLPDGSRVNAVIPPLAVKGPCLTIRKFSRQQFSMELLVEKNSISPQVVEFLRGCVRSKRSILISGGTGTGKTTLLNCLSQAIGTRERVICIEDTHELQLDHPHVVFVECRDGNNEGKGKVTIRDLLRNSLRQRPDRLIIGECRGDEALDMLQAMNTGHDGSMTTIHANTPADALRRLEVLVRDCGLSPDAIRQQIVSAIDVVVQLTRLPGGKRCVTHVTEVVGFDDKTKAIQLREIFQSVWDPSAQEARLRPTGCLPTFGCEIVRDGHVRLDLFLEGLQLAAGAQP